MWIHPVKALPLATKAPVGGLLASPSGNGPEIRPVPLRALTLQTPSQAYGVQLFAVQVPKPYSADPEPTAPMSDGILFLWFALIGCALLGLNALLAQMVRLYFSPESKKDKPRDGPPTS